MKQITLKRAQEYSAQIVRQTGSSIDTIFAQINTIQKQLTANAVTQRLFQNYADKTPPEKILMVKSIAGALSGAKRISPYIDQIYMVGADHTVFSSNVDVDPAVFLSSEWLQASLTEHTGSLITRPHPACYYNINATGRPPERLPASPKYRPVRRRSDCERVPPDRSAMENHRLCLGRLWIKHRSFFVCRSPCMMAVCFAVLPGTSMSAGYPFKRRRLLGL